MDTIGSRIRDRRKARDWRDVDLAKEAGVHIDLLRAIESGALNQPSVFDVLSIARALGTTVEDLAGTS